MRLKDERIDQSQSSFGPTVHNESSKLPGHKARMLAHFKRIHEVMRPIHHCNCGICKPNEEFNWEMLARRLIA